MFDGARTKTAGSSSPSTVIERCRKRCISGCPPAQKWPHYITIMTAARPKVSSCLPMARAAATGGAPAVSGAAMDLSSSELLIVWLRLEADNSSFTSKHLYILVLQILPCLCLCSRPLISSFPANYPTNRNLLSCKVSVTRSFITNLYIICIIVDPHLLAPPSVVTSIHI